MFLQMAVILLFFFLMMESLRDFVMVTFLIHFGTLVKPVILRVSLLIKRNGKKAMAVQC